MTLLSIIALMSLLIPENSEPTTVSNRSNLKKESDRHTSNPPACVNHHSMNLSHRVPPKRNSAPPISSSRQVASTTPSDLDKALDERADLESRIRAMHHLASKGTFHPLEQLLDTSNSRDIRLEAISLLRTSGKSGILGALRIAITDSNDPVVQECALRAMVQVAQEDAFDDLTAILEGDPTNSLRKPALFLLGGIHTPKSHAWLMNHFPSDSQEMVTTAISLYHLREIDCEGTSRRIAELAELADTDQNPTFEWIQHELEHSTGSLHSCGRTH
jgi:hypothetical protein